MSMAHERGQRGTGAVPLVELDQFVILAAQEMFAPALDAARAFSEQFAQWPRVTAKVTATSSGCSPSMTYPLSTTGA